jgi:serine-type D-Ala-D-Ala carboxypeptidase/endopeptidase (penicillin-binding protein 4)
MRQSAIAAAVLVLAMISWAFVAAPAAKGAASAKAAAKAAPAKAAPAKAVPAAPVVTASLKADLDRILAEAGAGTMSVRVVALADAAAGKQAEVLYAAGADQPMAPASNMKLVTTAACFDRYGPDWRIRTQIGRIPSAVKGAEWDLAVIGGGDPNLSGRFYGGDVVGAFRKWAEALKGRGVTAVGRVVLDDSLFDDVLQHPRWPANQRAEWYEAPISALVLNDSCVNVHVTAGKAGGPAVVRLDPPCGGVAVDGTIQTVTDKAAAFSIAALPADGPGAAMRLHLGGKFSAQAPEAVEYRTVVNPTLFFGEALAETLRAEGIAVTGPVVRDRLCDKTGKARADFVSDVTHTSRLDQTVTVANKRSQGLYAECLIKILGAYGAGGKIETELPPRQGTWAAGTAEALKWMADSKIPTEGCVMEDGSGLSKTDRLTALTVTELLGYMHARHGEAFMETLAVAGQDGSLAKRMKNTLAEGRVFGKTGYIAGTSALSGYVRAKSGRLVAFSVLMNDVASGDLWKAHQAQDRLCVRLVDY